MFKVQFFFFVIPICSRWRPSRLLQIMFKSSIQAYPLAFILPSEIIWSTLYLSFLMSWIRYTSFFVLSWSAVLVGISFGRGVLCLPHIPFRKLSVSVCRCTFRNLTYFPVIINALPFNRIDSIVRWR